MNSHWKGAYGYDTRHSMYFNEKQSRKTETDIGVGTREQTLKRCGIVKPDPNKSILPSIFSNKINDCPECFQR